MYDSKWVCSVFADFLLYSKDLVAGNAEFFYCIM